MGNRALSLIISSITQILKSKHSENYQLKESMILIGREGVYQNIYESFWEIRLGENLILEIEFLKELGDTEIHLFDQFGNTVYELQMTVVSSLHIIIDIKDWETGIYSIEIKDSMAKIKTPSYRFTVAYLLLFGKHPQNKPL